VDNLSGLDFPCIREPHQVGPEDASVFASLDTESAGNLLNLKASGAVN